MKIHPKRLEELTKPNNINQLCLSRLKGQMRLIITTRSGYKFVTNFVEEGELFASSEKQGFVIF